jgi:hypothetical protein
VAGKRPILINPSSQGRSFNLSASAMTFVPPKTYTAYAFTRAGGKLEKLSVDWKDPNAGEIVVKVLACGVCHRFVYRRRYIILRRLI